MKIYHNTRKTEYRDPFGAAEVSSEVKLSIRTKEEHPEEKIESVTLRLWQDDQGETLIKMKKEEGKYTARVHTPKEGCLLWYYFIIRVSGKENENLLYYGNNPNQTGGEGCIYEEQPPSFQITVFRYERVPKWFQDGIVYQIFPDRFARDKDWKERCQAVIEATDQEKGQKKILEEDWYQPAYYRKDEDGKVTEWPFYGGSIKGIQDKLEYLQSMGVTAIYLNPICKASSNHRYDTGDYLSLDPMLGTEDDFQEFAKAARQAGISIILDGVFSHTGADSIYFDKYGNYGGKGAFDNEDSEYRSWYEFKEDDPIGYRCWWGVDDLPEVNEKEEGFRQLICGKDGVLAKWIGLGARGWRLDVADELPDAFIREIRDRVKAASEDNLLMGEVWEDASNKVSYGEKRKYFMGDELDSTMNYPVRDIILGLVRNGAPIPEMEEKLLSLKENYPKENFYGAMNLIGSHDRERILTIMGADENYDDAARRVKMAALLQYTLPGVPCIYYGDEAGMTGGADPENRSGFIWNRENPDLQFYYRQLGLLYQEHPVLRKGDIRMVSDSLEYINGDPGDVFAFLREGDDGQEKILVLVNRGSEVKSVSLEKVSGLDAGYGLELFSSSEYKGKNGTISEIITMEPLSFRMICIQEEAPEQFEMKRSAGVICHISSIPGGKLGKPARDFIDYLVTAGISIWQILPVNPPGLGNSPYSSNAAFAGNAEWVNEEELPDMDGYDQFCLENRYWLEDYAAYTVLKKRFGGSEWSSWPEGYRDRYRFSLDQNGTFDFGLPEEELKNIKREQYYFARQWQELRLYANENNIKIMGDLPVFVSADSADVWANRELFLMDETGNQTCHAGVPPDYFSPEGQDWGNPLYDWAEMKQGGYQWWIRRLGQCAERYDYVRLDHFRSFSEYYSIPSGKTPAFGIWKHGPGIDFFRAVKKAFGPNLKILAEDLGQLDTGVYNLLKLAGLPGMNVWQFSQYDMEMMTDEQAATRAFYSGTHDNQTIMGWVAANGGDASDALGIIRKIYESGSPWAMVQFQDLFLLGDEHRMNVPGTPTGNWSWKIPGDSLAEAFDSEKETPFANADKIAKAFKLLAKETGRADGIDADSFLKSHGMNINRLDPEAMTDQMVAYYERALRGGRLDITPYMESEESENVIAIDMGGSNIRVAKVHLQRGESPSVSVERQIRKQTPGRESRVSFQQLFDEIASMVDFVDRRGECNKIGFSFSFPIQTLASGDAIALEWDKELQIQGGIGRKVGEMLIAAFGRTGQPSREIRVMNDTVTTLMAHRAIHTGGRECLAGFVLGTGENVCYLSPDKKKIYNLESGNYDGFERSEFDLELDAKSESQGNHLAEKMISGVYIGQLVNIVSSKAIEEGIVSAEMKLPKDKIILADIKTICLQRASIYSAVTVASAVKLAAGDRIGNFVVMADGSVFWKTPGMKDKIESLVNEILKPSGISIEFIGIPDASLVGAAEAL